MEKEIVKLIEKQEREFQLAMDEMDKQLDEFEIRNAVRLIELIRLQHDLIVDMWRSQYSWLQADNQALYQRLEERN